MPRRQDRLQSEVGTFMKQYGRGGAEYDRDVEREIKRMDPWELDELLNGESDERYAEDDLLADFDEPETEPAEFEL